LEVTVRRGRPGRVGGEPYAIVHWADLPPTDITTQFAIPTTTVIRTIIDLSAVVSDDILEKALDDALRRKLFTIKGLERRLRETHPGGWRRLSALQRLVAARGLDYVPGDTRWEDLIHNWLVSAGFPAPTRQHWVTLNGEPRQIDLAYPDLKIAIEYDGWEFHQMRRKFDDDRARAGELQLANWLVLQFTSNSTEEEVLSRVSRARSLRSGEGDRR
jgi:very-short-patch-repair endonuclease